MASIAVTAEPSMRSSVPAEIGTRAMATLSRGCKCKAEFSAVGSLAMSSSMEFLYPLCHKMARFDRESLPPVQFECPRIGVGHFQPQGLQSQPAAGFLGELQRGAANSLPPPCLLKIKLVEKSEAALKLQAV